MSVKMTTLKNRHKKPIVAGQKYGRLTPIQYDSGFKKWECVCECGTLVFVKSAALNNGNTRSCGCLQKDISRNIGTKHGMSDSKLQRVWSGMKQRCYNPNNKSYHYYGGKGIKVCDEWKEDFQAFYDWAMSNGYKEGLTIDRIDVNGNYEPSNCRWVTQKQNNENRRLVRLKNGQYASVKQ